MELVTNPAGRVALGVTLGSDAAVLGQIVDHLWKRHRGLALEPPWLLLHHFALFGPAALALWHFGRGDLHRFLAGLNGRRIACDVTDQPILVGSLDQRLVHTGRQFAGRKLGKGSLERRLARYLSGALPTAQPTQALVRPKVSDQHRSCRRLDHHFGDERAGQRGAIKQRSTWKTRPTAHERLDANQWEAANVRS